MPRPTEQERMWRLAGRYMGVGIEMAIDLALPTLVALWLDKRYGTAPWIMLFGLLVGLGAVTRTIMRIIKMVKKT